MDRKSGIKPIQYSNNSISLIRMYSAVVVMLWHTIAHLNLSVPEWINSILSWMSPVPVFMMISGFLIWKSIEKSKSYKQYIINRIARIYPELWASVILGVVVMLLLFGTGGDIVALLLYIVCQATLFQFWTPESLRGYGYGTPNGALSTISIIFQFYIIAWAMNKLLKKRKVWIWFLVWLLSVLLSVVGHECLSKGPEVFVKLFDVSALRYLWLFLGGCFISEFFDVIAIKLRRFWFVPLIIVFFVRMLPFCDIDAGYNVIHSTLMFIGLLGASYAFPQLKIKYDISYEIYLYHMIVVNALIQLGFCGNIVSLWLTLIITVCISIVSFLTIGKLSNYLRVKNSGIFT